MKGSRFTNYEDVQFRCIVIVLSVECEGKLHDLTWRHLVGPYSDQPYPTLFGNYLTAPGGGI